MRVLVMGIAGLFGGFLVPLLLIAAYRQGARWTTGSPGDVGFPITYGPETLALVGMVALPVLDAVIRRRRGRRSPAGAPSSSGRP
jgi:hypothetical protein